MSHTIFCRYNCHMIGEPGSDFVGKSSKIAFVIGSASVGGAEKQIINLAFEFKERGFDCEIIYLFKGGALEEVAQNLRISYRVIGISRKNFLFQVFSFIQLLKLQRAHIYYLFLPHTILILGPLLRWFAKSSLKVYAVRGSIFRKKNLFYWIYHRELPKGDLIICNSRSLEGELSKLKNFSKEKIKVIENGVSRNNSIQAKSVDNQKFLKVAIVANFNEHKGHQIFLDALKIIQKPRLHVTFIGSGILLESVKNQTSFMTVHSFTFLENIHNLNQVLSEQDFAVHPSRTEGFSNAILEELAAGLPVIAFRVGGNAEIIENNKTGILIEPFEIETLVNAIVELGTNAEWRANMAIEALSVSEKFSWSKNIDRHLEAFATLEINDESF